MDPVTLVTGAVLAAVFYALGRIDRRRRRPREPRPVCGCDHHHALHDLKTGECHGQVEREIRGYHNTLQGIEFVPCACRRYSGPIPLDTYVAPELTDNAG